MRVTDQARYRKICSIGEDLFNAGSKTVRRLGKEAQEAMNQKMSRDRASAYDSRQADASEKARPGGTGTPKGGSRGDASRSGASKGYTPDTYGLVAPRAGAPGRVGAGPIATPALIRDEQDILRRQFGAIARLSSGDQDHYSNWAIAQVLTWKERQESVQTISEQTGIPIGKIYDWWRQSRGATYWGAPTRTLERSLIPKQITDGLRTQRRRRNLKFDDETIGQVLVWKAEGETTGAIVAQEKYLNCVSVNKWWRLYQHHIWGGMAPGAEGMDE